MGIPQTNRAVQAYALESTPGTLPGSPIIRSLGPNAIGDFSPEVEMVARDPIGPMGMEELGGVVDKICNGTMEMDLIGDHFDDFAEGALRCAWSTGPVVLKPTSCTTAHFVVASGGALVENTLVYVRGCSNSSNNGLKHVAASSTSTNLIITGGLTAETFATADGVTVEVCGFRFTSGDLQVNASGNLITSTKDLTQLGLTKGQSFWLGGDSATDDAFATAANRGLARVAQTITANLLVPDNTTTTWAVDNGSGKTIDLYYGRQLQFITKTDARYVERTYHVETLHYQLSAGSADMYEYATGQAVSEMTVTCPPKDKVTMNVAFIGKDSESPTTSRKSGWNAPIRQNQTAAFTTVSNILRGRIRSGSTAYTGYITSANIKISTGAARNLAHGTQGSVLTTFDNSKITVEVNAYFDKPDVIAALVAGTQLAADWCFRNGDGAIMFDLPAVQLGGGKRSYPRGETVKIDLAVGGKRESTFNSSLIVSRFPYCPAS
jgi:hypothetical protein